MREELGFRVKTSLFETKIFLIYFILELNYINMIYEIINGNGKVKEYSPSGILFFDGEYKNGKKLKGKEYFHKNGNIKF